MSRSYWSGRPTGGVPLAASTAAMLRETMLIARLGRGPAAAGVAVLSIAHALPTMAGGA